MASQNSKLDDKSERIFSIIAASMILGIVLFMGFAWGMLGTTIALCKHHHCNPYPELVEKTKN